MKSSGLVLSFALQPEERGILEGAPHRAPTMGGVTGRGPRRWAVRSIAARAPANTPRRLLAAADGLVGDAQAHLLSGTGDSDRRFSWRTP